MTPPLIERLEAAEVGGIALNGAIHRSLFPDDLIMTDAGSVGPIKREAVRQPLSEVPHVPDDVIAECMNVPAYSTSLDAALSLAGRVLPGWIWDVSSTGTCWMMPPNEEDPTGETHISAKGNTPALALVAAILKAKGAGG